MQGASVVDPACLVLIAPDMPFLGSLVPHKDVVLGIRVSPYKGHHSVILELGHTSHLGNLDEILVPIRPIHIITHD